MTSGETVSVGRCDYCGREFDIRRFQVRVIGSRASYDSTECALLDADGQPAPLRRIRRAEREGGLKRS